MHESTDHEHDALPDDGIVDMGYHYPSNPPAPTPTNPGVDLLLNNSEFHAGDPFTLRSLCSGPTGENLDLYVILDLEGCYWFYPDWTRTPCCQSITLLDQQMNDFFILDFVCPEGAGQGDNVWFRSAMFRPETSEIVGKFDCISFSFRQSGNATYLVIRRSTMQLPGLSFTAFAMPDLSMQSVPTAGQQLPPNRSRAPEEQSEWLSAFRSWESEWACPSE